MIWRDIRLLLLAGLVLFSLYYILSPSLFGKPGVVVNQIGSDARCANVGINSVITQVDLYAIKSIEDYNLATSAVTGGQYVQLIADNRPADCIAVSNGELGISVDTLKKENLVFGIDIQGGSRVLLKPKESISKQILTDTIDTLNTRINLYGLRDVRISPLGEDVIQIEMGGATTAEVTGFVSKQGKFEGKLEEVIKLTGGKGSFPFNDRNIETEFINGTLRIDGRLLKVNESFPIDDIRFEIRNVTDGSVVVWATVFTGSDIIAVFTDAENSFINRLGDVYEFAFSVQISSTGAEKFARLTKNQPVRLLGSSRYLEPELLLFLDNEPITRLNIAASLAGETLTRPQIQGVSETKEEALKERLKLQSVLRSGSLPVELEIIKADVVTQTAGKAFLNSVIYVALAAALVVSIVIFIRYRDFKIAVPMILISFSEILIVLGFAAFSQAASKGSGWILDIPAIAGLIAIIGTGVNQFIIITDKLLQDPDASLKYRHKIAMEMIFNSAYTVIAAMLPLMVVGVGALKGFAITTILGVIIAIVVTRPAYMSILEKAKKLH